MGSFNNLTNQCFGYWTVTTRATNAGQRVQWNVTCKCGNTSTVSASNLTSGKTKSCGCFRVERNKEFKTSHGMSGERLQRIHTNMLQRCNNPNSPAFKYYGAKGVTVDVSWRKFEGFRDWAVANGYEDNLTIDRIDGGGHYGPANCRWITQREQTRNREGVLCYPQVDAVKSLLKTGLTNRQVSDATNVPIRKVRRIKTGDCWL